MRLIGIGVAAALAFVALTPAAALAARGPGGAPAGYDANSSKKGMTEAPAVIQAAGVSCTPTAAGWMGAANDAKAKTNTNIYEVACSEGLGFVLLSTTSTDKANTAPPPAPQVFTCLQTNAPTPDGKPNQLACKLPANADTKAGLQPYLAKAGSACVVDKARAIGANDTNAYFEVACQGGDGVVIETAAGPSLTKAVDVTSCLDLSPNDVRACKLTDPKAMVTAVVAELNSKSGKACQAKDQRYMLSTQQGDRYFEIACADGKGYVFQQAKNGALTQTIDCAVADFVNGGCTLTDSRTAQTEQNALYTKLAKAANYDCDVAKYGPLRGEAGVDVVELQCSNRPDGAVALFSSSAAKPTRVYNCVESELWNYRCSFTKADVLYPKVTDNLKSLGKNSCTVSGVHVIGSNDTDGYVEVACSDGLPGWVIRYSKPDTKPKEALSCSQASGIGGGCTLPTNVKKG